VYRGGVHPTGGPLSEAERARLLLDVSNALVANLTREALFHAIAEALRRVVPFDRTAVFLHDPEADVLRLFVLESRLPSSYFAVGLEVAPLDSHVGWVFQHRRPRVRRDLAVEREYPAEERAYRDGVRAYAIVPLVARGRSVGTLAVGSVAPGCYGDAEVALLQEVAGQVALAIENMRAYEEIASLKARLERENVYLQEEIKTQHDFDEIVGDSPALRRVLDQVDLVARADSTVLLLGETGTGKELVARAIHGRSGRRDRPLIKVNCAALPGGLVESELFGHVKGAFTEALQRRTGRFELADGGTVFLDEAGELPPEAQAKLLRVLQEGEFEPVGTSQTVRVDVRVIAATNRDLQAEVRAGRFRPDLFYRLSVLPLTLPPLRERREDIPLLVAFLIDRFARRFGKRLTGVSEATMARLVAYDWPGNVRELQNVLERAVVLSRGPLLAVDADLAAVGGGGPAPPAAPPGLIGPAPRAPSPAAGAPPADAGIPAPLEEVERRHIAAVLARTGGVVEGPRGAAAILGLHPNTLRSRMKKLGLRRARLPHDIP
jgi:formate hydrogenlyase transcriptional activator